MDVPSMVRRSGDTLIIRSVVSGDQIFLNKETGNVIKTSSASAGDNDISILKNTAYMDDLDVQCEPKDENLPQCKIKRNYSCSTCTFFTQNPRYFLTHLRDIHGEKIVINECKLCLYASRHYQKLVRHMKMVHGSLDGVEEQNQIRKRYSGREGRKRKIDDTAAIPLYTQHKQKEKEQQDKKQEQQNSDQYNVKFEDNYEASLQNRLLKCSVCEFTTLQRDNLIEHEQYDHCKTKFFRCGKCNYVTHIKARYSKHIKYHSMPMIKCDVCDFRTPYKWNLDRHMKNHGGAGPFRCAACNFTADIKQSLTVHEMNHHVPPVGHAAGMCMARRKNKVGGTDNSEDFMSENGDLDNYNNNNNINNNNNNNINDNNADDLYEPYKKQCRYLDTEQPTDLSQKKISLESSPQLKKASRPVPNLIPIHTGNTLNLSKTFFENFDDSKNTFKDIATFFFPDGKFSEMAKLDKIDNPQLSPSSNSSSTASKKRGKNFFDKIKQSLAVNAAKSESLMCNCGYTSKCLSEAIIHRSSCQRENQDKFIRSSPINLSVNTRSTRCQYCRHRCKSSIDLTNHLTNCTEVNRGQQDSLDSVSETNEMPKYHITDEDQQQTKSFDESHPMENKIFIWNKASIDESNKTLANIKQNEQTINENISSDTTLNTGRNNENGYYGIETAPGYGEVTKKMTLEEEGINSSLKKVYKCPHCSFWASTASRFHVHIVGHLNKKPFECSLCAYRSNWRWDITKHIRLKTIRDPSHKNAKVLMNDETGRRNYTKYNKYITLMKVTEEDGDPKLMKSGEMTPKQEASLAFLNDRKSNTGKSSVAMPVKFPLFSPPMNSQNQHISKEIGENGNISGPLLIKPTEEGFDLKTDESGRKTFFKCRKCDFRHPNRDKVLSHVKKHYKEIEMNMLNKPNNLITQFQSAFNTNVYMNEVFATMCISQQSGKSKKSIISNQVPMTSLPSSVDTSLTSSLNATSNTLMPLPLEVLSKAPININKQGEANERHCRLKHNGDIRIESFDRTNRKNLPIYHPLSIQSGSNVLSNQNNSSVHQNNYLNVDVYDEKQNNFFDGTVTNTKIDQGTENDKTNTNENNRNQLSLSSHFEKNLTNEQILNNDSRLKRMPCPCCPFISESKSQMNYHISLHKFKPDQYECQSCAFTCSKKLILNHNCKTFNEDSGPNSVTIKAIDLTSKDIENDKIVSKLISFCSICPARYICNKELNLHLKSHQIQFPYRCNVCSFTTRQESYLLSHFVVHTKRYQDKTQILCKKFKEDPDYPQPKLHQIKLKTLCEKLWIVDICSKKIENENKLNSLLKQQLESNNKTTASTSSSEQLILHKQFTQKAIEECLYCPFKTNNAEHYKSHIANHQLSSGGNKKNNENNHDLWREYVCDHCEDYKVVTESELKEHIRLHFKPIKDNKNVTFCTSYDNLELLTINSSYDDSDDDTNGKNNNSNTTTNYKKIVFENDNDNNALPLLNSNDKQGANGDCMTIVDGLTGELINAINSSI